MPMICSQSKGELHSSRERHLKPRYIGKYDFACNIIHTQRKPIKTVNLYCGCGEGVVVKIQVMSDVK